MWTIDHSERVALVTGASRGIGREVALGLAQAGASVVGVARSAEDLDSIGRAIQGTGGDFLAVRADVSDVESLSAVVATAWEWQGQIDILINAAGTIVRTEPPDVTTSDWDRVFGVNLRGPFFLIQDVGRRMFERGAGSIVNITSLAGESVTGASLTYQASKAGLIHLTRGFAQRLAPFVRVNAVGPGYIRTSLNEAWLAHEDNERYVQERTAARRVGEPADVVGAVVFLSSADAGYITGQHLRVDGGWGR